MAVVMKECRVCGKQYKACHTWRPNPNSEFRWRDVACSPECGSIYLAEIEKSRSPKGDTAEKTPENKETSEISAEDTNEELDADEEYETYLREIDEFFDNEG